MMPTLRTAVFATLAAAVVALAGCERKPAPAAKPAAPEVVVERPVVRPVSEYEDFTGRTEAVETVDIAPQVTGKLSKRHFADGDYVTKGQPLFEIDPTLFRADVEKARADVENWKAQIKLAGAEMKRAELSLKQGVGSQADYDKAEAQQGIATANRDSAIAQAKKAKEQLDYCTIRAPFTGRLSSRKLDDAAIVKENETILTTLKRLDRVYITFDIDERTLLRLRRLLSEGKIESARDSGLEVLVGLADEEGYSFHAPLTFFDNALDQNTGTLRLRAEMENPSLRQGVLPAVVGAAAAVPAEVRNLRLLSPGMFVRVRLPVGVEKPKLLIPEQALGSDQGQRFVYVVTDQNKAEYRRVKVGPPLDQMRAVEDGLKPTDRVVVKGLQRVAAGREVKPVEAKKATPTAASGVAAAK